MEETHDTQQPPQEPPHPQEQPFIFDQLKDYAETRFKLAKYRAIEGGTSIAAGIIADIVVTISMAMAFIFASVTLAFYLAEVFNSDWKGFACVGVIYLLIAIVVRVNRKGLERPIVNAIIRKIFK